MFISCEDCNLTKCYFCENNQKCDIIRWYSYFQKFDDKSIIKIYIDYSNTFKYENIWILKTFEIYYPNIYKNLDKINLLF